MGDTKVEREITKQAVYEEIRKELGFLGMPTDEDESEALARAFVAARLRLREVEQERDNLDSPQLCGHMHRAQYATPGAPCGIHCAMCDLAAAESRLVQAGKLAEAARLHIETDPFSYTIQGDDTCQWCRRDRPRVEGTWSDEVWWSEDFHNADCEGRRVATEARAALIAWDKLI